MTDTFQSAGAVAANVVDRWSWWLQALKGKFGPIHDGEPNQGYYRVRRKDGPWEPVAIWQEEDGTWLAYRNGKEVRADDIWTWVCRNPISFEAYEKAMAGGGFDDEPKQATIGDNSGDADPFDALRIEYEGEAELAREFLKAEVKSQADADKAGIWSKRLADISKRADGEREREKAPHLQASRAVDDKWRPLVGDAKDMATSLKRHVEPFLIAQKRAEEARARAAAEEAARLRREVDAAAAAAHAGPQVDEKAEAERAELVRQAQEAEKAAEVQNATAGRTGARVALRTDKRAKIVDFDACLAALKDRPEVIELVQSLANRAVKSGFALAGVEVELVEKVA
ncbi:hypothetical protein NKJ51_12565 [Mesorhizobium sp. M0134]|uniref:hypothetical protein n=1 Tax=Mesorhizobium sp. M0134 TaxID=2956889 RepID=UPI0033369318